MKKFCKYAIILLPICFLTIAASLIFLKMKNETKYPIYIEYADALYSDAIASLSGKDLQLAVSENINYSIANSNYTITSNYLIDYDNLNSKNVNYHLLADQTSGLHAIEYEDFLFEGNFYRIISGVAFSGIPGINNNNQIHFNALEFPTLTSSIYEKITGLKTENGYQITFDEPTAVEQWLVAERILPHQAQGIVNLSEDGCLISYSYSATFVYNSLFYDVTYVMTPKSSPIEITLPERSWVNLDSLNGALALEQSVGLLLQTNSIISNYQEDLYFEALGDRKTASITLQLDSTLPLTASIVTTTTTANDSRLDQFTQTTNHETFENGKYSIMKENGETSVSNEIDDSIMVNYLQNQLISTVMLPEFIENCFVENGDTTTFYHFTGNAAFTEFLCQSLCEQLYQDSDLLKNTAIETDYLNCYIEIDPSTSRLLASGISFSAHYEKEALPYNITYTAKQFYQYNVK